MSRTTIKVTQFVFVHDRGDTGIITIVENERENDTFRMESRHGTAPLYDCAVSNWEALRELLIEIAQPWKLRLNCNVLGTREEKRAKNGEYKSEILADRHTHDSRLTAWIHRAMRRRYADEESDDEIDGDGGGASPGVV